MAESIKEAEKEYAQKKKGSDVIRDMITQNTQEEQEPMDAVQKKKVNAMTEELITGALNSKSRISFNGSDVDVTNVVDLDKATQEI